mgnify:CR=1 FL=1
MGVPYLQLPYLSGQFYFNKLKSGTYVLNISYVGYKAFMETVKIANTSNKINVYMQENSQLLGEVAVTGRATRAEQRVTVSCTMRRRSR